ncbi:MAG: M1 family aminopeptidase [Thermoprotei archaeon]
MSVNSDLKAKVGRDFAFPEYRPRYPRDPLYKLRHIRAELKIDVWNRSVDGKVTYIVNGNRSHVTYIDLDAVEMIIKAVKNISGKELRFDYDGKVLRVYPETEISDDTEYTFIVEYSAKPRKGLYFILPDKYYPDRVPQVWSQGEAEDNKYWLPIYDYPNNKTTAEIIITTQSNFVVVSNGDLVSIIEKDGWKTWHWKLDKPNSTYLLSIAIGDFSKFEEVHDGIKFEYYVPRGRENDVERSFRKTPDMMRFFSEYTGIPYPYKRYAQVCVSDFIFGGMENVTAATLTDTTLHDEKAHMDFFSEPLVAHELAHQWFGDMVTTKDWANIWLNESFATYFENLYLERDRGNAEFIYEVYRDLQSYLDEYRTRYARPIVTRLYAIPDEVFDGHAYPKGAVVLHMLRNIIGDEMFRKAINLYLNRYKFSNADTEDLRKCIEEVTGKNFEWFFDQFVYSSGHPVLKISYSWEPNSKLLKITIKQTQGDDSLSVYRLPLEIEIRKGSIKIRKTFWIDEREQILYIPFEDKPDYVCIDPELKNLMVLDIDAGIEEWIKQLECEYVYCKILAANALGKIGGSRAVEALKKALISDEYWFIKSESAKALGKIGSSEAREALLEGLEKVKEARARRSIVDALSNFKEDNVATALLKVLKNNDESYYVRYQAAVSLGKMKRKEYFNDLVEVLSVPSHNYVITVGSLLGLGELGSDDALKIIMDHTELGKPGLVRIGAILALAKFPGKVEVIKKLEELSKDPDLRIRSAVIRATAELMDPRLLPMLDALSATDLHGRIIRSARETAVKIRSSMEKGLEYKQLREELDKIREENRKLLERIAKIESKG